MPWMSPWNGSGPSSGRCTQVSPPSRLLYTPSTSMPAQMVRLSRGSTITLVVRGMPTGQGMVTPRLNSSQVFPPSRERNASGRVPANIVSGSVGSTVTDQIWRSSIGEFNFSQVPALSSLRKMPWSVPARMRWGSSGYTDSALMLDSEGMGSRMRSQVSPPSTVRDSPPPTVATTRVNPSAMAEPP